MRYSKKFTTIPPFKRIQRYTFQVSSLLKKFVIASNIFPIRKEFTVVHQTTYHFSILEDIHIFAKCLSNSLERKTPINTIKLRLNRYFKLQNNVTGILIIFKGRIRGAELARSQRLSFGSIPKSTINANIQYTSITCFLLEGTVGIRIWIARQQPNTPENKPK